MASGTTPNPMVNPTEGSRSMSPDEPAHSKATESTVTETPFLPGDPGSHGNRQMELWGFGRLADVQLTPTHISSVEPFPQVTKCGWTLRRMGSSWERVGS